MPPLSLKSNDLKGHFGVQTQKIQGGSLGKWMWPHQFIPAGSLARGWFLHFCHEFLEVSTAKPLPAKSQSSSSGWLQPDHLAEPEGGKAKHLNLERQEHLFIAKDAFRFRSCINVLHEPENQHDGMMPSARSISDYALQAIRVFPFRSCHWGLCVFSVFPMWCLRHANTHLGEFLMKGGIVCRLAVKWGR